MTRMNQERPTAPKVAVFGCGHWGKNLLRNFAELGALAALSDPNQALEAEKAEAYGVPAGRLPEILADPAIDGVVIAAPAELHFKLAQEALAADKHVYVEKPLALVTDEARILCELAEERQRILMVGHLLQYHPVFLRLKAMVMDGELGRLQYIYSNRLNLGKIRLEENALWSFAPHDISMILSLVGMQPDSVSTVGARYLHKVLHDVTTTHMTFPNGVNAHIFVSWLHPFKEQKLVVVGDKAMMVFDDRQPWESKLLIYPHRIEWIDGVPTPSKADPTAVEVAAEEPLRAECQHFLDCLRTGAVPRTDGWEGLRVLTILQAAEQSMAQGGGAIPLTKGVAAAPRPADPPPVDPPLADPPLADFSPANFPDVFIHPSACVDTPCEIGAGTKIWHFSHILAGTALGRNCVVGQNVMIGPEVTVGHRCKIQNNVSLYRGVTLEDGVFCGPSAVFTNVLNPRAEIERKDEFRATRVERGATIGANATILCGHTLGRYCLIAAGAVVTGDVPPHALMVGMPARRVGWVSHAGERLDEALVCPREGRRYRVTGPDRLEEIPAA